MQLPYLVAPLNDFADGEIIGPQPGSFFSRNLWLYVAISKTCGLSYWKGIPSGYMHAR